MRAFEAAMNTVWALEPEALRMLLTVARREGDPEAVAARVGRRMEGARSVTVRDGVAVVPVIGPIFRRANLFTEISGATSIELMATEFTRALEDPAVKAILLDIDSPGGEVNGTGEFAAMVRRGAKTKPVWAYVGGTGASGAYYIASAAERVIAAPSAVLGSIGVVMVWRNHLEPGEVELVSSVSPLKRATPDTAEGRNELQRVVDALAGVFVREVADYRGVSKEQVLERFGAGGMLVGAEAVAVGMADALGSFEEVISALSTGEAGKGPRGPRGPKGHGANGSGEEVRMDRGVALDAAAVEAMQGKLDRALGAIQALEAAEERRKVGASLETITFPDSLGALRLSPACCEELTGVLAGFDAEQRQPLLTALSHLRLVPKTETQLGGHEGGAVLTAADMAVIQESARLKKRPVADVQRDFMAARERQIADGRYRGARG